MKIQLLYIIVLMLFVFGLNAQNDTSVLHLSRLSTDDLLSQKRDSQIYQTSLVNWSNLPLHQSPFETYIFTQDEIALLGCNTLVDILKYIPGIRTSKVGSSTEGELFISNGMRGNEYFQFLINGIPIRNLVLDGMSLGAQFPIKQAEKIEIYLGNACSMYGMQAGAGVINIVMKQSERPVYTFANLSFGSNKYNNIDVNFGGKIGKGKRIIRFNAYGGYTTSNDWNNHYLYENNYNQANYDSRGTYLTSSNYRPEQSDTTFFTSSTQPHFSRYFGLNLQMKRFYVSYLNMIRHDHSAIGLNPTAIDFTDEGTYFEDNINKVSIGYKINNKKWFLHAYTGTLTYKVNQQSSSIFIKPQISYTLDTFSHIADKQFAINADELSNASKRITSIRSFTNGDEFSLPFEFLLKHNLFNHLTIGGGLQSMLSIFNNPIYAYNNRNVFDIDDARTILPNHDYFGQLNTYILGEYHTDKTYIIANIANNSNDFGNTNSLRFGINQHFKLFKRHFLISGNITQGQIAPSMRYVNNSYSLPIIKENGIWQRAYQIATADNSTHIEGIQKQASYRTALKYFNNNRWIEASMEQSKLNGLYTYTALNNKKLNDTTYILQSGFIQNPSQYFVLNKFSIVYNRIVTKRKSNNTYFKNVGKQFTQISYTRNFGREVFSDGKSLDFIRQVPTSILKWHTYVDVLKYVSFGWNLNFNSAFYPSITTPDNYKSDAIKYYKDNTRNLSMDFMIAYHFNQNFYTQLRIFNLANRNIAGIEATETPDDLKINTQPHRIFQVALHYNLDVQPQ